jgi:hypothetical protein
MHDVYANLEVSSEIYSYNVYGHNLGLSAGFGRIYNFENIYRRPL